MNLIVAFLLQVWEVWISAIQHAWRVEFKLQALEDGTLMAQKTMINYIGFEIPVPRC